MSASVHLNVHKDPRDFRQKEERAAVSRIQETEQNGRGLHLNESNSWLDLNCDSGPELRDVMKTRLTRETLAGVPCPALP